MFRSSRYTPWVVVLSIVVPAGIAALYFSETLQGYDTGFLPSIYANINAATALVLVAGFLAIRRKNITLHRNLMFLAILLSATFLVMYVIYHATNESTAYPGEGWRRSVYLFVLLSHILLSVALVPLVLITFVRALSRRFDKHRRIARVTLPIWLYVAISGVVVYLMISPYYPG